MDNILPTLSIPDIDLSNTSDPPPSISNWPFSTLRDAYQPFPPTRYAIEGLFALPSLNIVYGAPGCLKSMLVADAAICVASGQPWLPLALDDSTSKHFRVEQGPVVWIDLDNGPRRTQERFAALGRDHNAPPDVPFNYISIPMPRPNAHSYPETVKLIKRLQDFQPLLIVIDNLGTVSGGVDENSSGMIEVMANLRHMAEQTGAALIVIHHQSKARRRQTAGRPGDALRGHSSIEASLDLALHIERKDKCAVVKITATKERGAQIPDLGAVFQFRRREGSQDLATARFWGCPPEADSKAQAVEVAVRQTLATGPVDGKTAFIESIHTTLKKSVYDDGSEAPTQTPIGVTTIRKIVEALIAKGIVVSESLNDGRNTHRISLAHDPVEVSPIPSLNQ